MEFLEQYMFKHKELTNIINNLDQYEMEYL